MSSLSSAHGASGSAALLDSPTSSVPGRVAPVARGYAGRQSGLRLATESLAYRLLRRTFRLQVGHVLCLDLAELLENENVASAIDCRQLTAEEVRDYATDPANELEVSLADRLEQGHAFCFGAFRGGELAGYSWFALGAIGPEHSLGLGLEFPADTAYVFKAFTRPEYRGQGFYPATIRHVAPWFIERGVSRLIMIVEHATWASLRSHYSFGCREIDWFALGHRPFRLCRQPKRLQKLGMRFTGLR